MALRQMLYNGFLFVVEKFHLTADVAKRPFC
jgi:hypothetical protein